MHQVRQYITLLCFIQLIILSYFIILGKNNLSLCKYVLNDNTFTADNNPSAL